MKVGRNGKRTVLQDLFLASKQVLRRGVAVKNKGMQWKKRTGDRRIKIGYQQVMLPLVVVFAIVGISFLGAFQFQFRLFNVVYAASPEIVTSECTTGTNSNSITITLTATQGDVMVVTISGAITDNVPYVAPVTDTRSNTYVSMQTQTGLFDSGVVGEGAFIWMANITSSSGSDTITIQTGYESTDMWLAGCAYVVSNVAISGFIFFAGSYNALDDNHGCMSFNSLGGGSLWLAVFAQSGSADTSVSISAPADFTLDSESPIDNSYGFLYGSAHYAGSLSDQVLGFVNDPDGYYCQQIIAAYDYVPTGCNIYACSTSTYTYTNYACTGDISGCSTFTSTTEFYNTSITQTDCTNTVSHDQNGCIYTVTSATGISTAVSTSFVVDTTTSTSTAYQINAPSTSSFTYWLFPVLFVGFGVALTDGTVVGAKKGHISDLNERSLIFLTLFGATLGASIGVIAGVMNWVWIVLLATVTVIYMWLSR